MSRPQRSPEARPHPVIRFLFLGRFVLFASSTLTFQIAPLLYLGTIVPNLLTMHDLGKVPYVMYHHHIFTPHPQFHTTHSRVCASVCLVLSSKKTYNSAISWTAAAGPDQHHPKPSKAKIQKAFRI